MSLQAKIKRLIRDSTRQGFRHVQLSNQHHRFYSPNGRDIIQCSSTTRDGGWWGKFMSEMKKAGYDDGRRAQQATVKERKKMEQATTSLGEAIKAAQLTEAVPPPEAGKGERRGAKRESAREFFRLHPGKTYSIAEVAAVLRSKGFSNSSNYTIGIMLAALCVEGTIVRKDPGHYQLAAKESTKPAAPSPALPLIDGDELELDEALAALGRIEAVVRKYKGVIRQLADLKRLLGGISGG